MKHRKLLVEHLNLQTFLDLRVIDQRRAIDALKFENKVFGRLIAQQEPVERRIIRINGEAIAA